MAKTPNELSAPSLRDSWSNAKKKAKKAAADLDKKNNDKKKSQQKAYETLAKKGFSSDLGPNLDKWVKLYPDYPKMEKLRTGTINPTLKAYMQAAKDSGLDKSIYEPLQKALASVGKEQKARAQKAETLIGSDMSLAIKESKEKIPPPIVVFKHPDVVRLAVAKAGKLKNIEAEGKLSLAVIIDSKEVLKQFSEKKEYVNQSQKIKDAGDFGKLVSDIAVALKTADKNVGNGSKLAAEQKKMDGAIEDAISDCIDRATAEAARLGKLKKKAAWANVKRAGKLVLAIGGAAASVAGLAMTPFTLGVSTVAGCLGLAKASVEIGRQLADIASTAEMMANGIAKDLNTLKKQYDKWLRDPEVKKAGGVSNKVGMAELTKRGVNALAPTMITTLKSVKDDVGTYDEKIDNLEVKADKLGDNLSDWLAKQREADKAFKEIQKLGRDSLSDTEFKLLTKILGNIDKITKRVDKIIKEMIKLNARVKKNRTNSSKLAKELKAISVKNPVWSEVGSAIFEVTASVAFSLAGNVNAPDPYKCAKTAADIINAVDLTREQIQQTVDLAENLRDAHKKHLKKSA